MTNQANTTSSNPLGEVHSITMRMTDLARTIMRLHPDSITRLSCVIEYKICKAKAKTIRDSITDTATRKEATWYIRTAIKPVDNTGRRVA